MPALIECPDCRIGFTDEVLLAHRAQGHKLWTCRVCSNLVCRVIAWGPVQRLAVCSWTCYADGLERGHCRRCLKPPTPEFVRGHCSSCRLVTQAPESPARFTIDELDSFDEADPDERAAWLPAQYRRLGWRLDHSMFDEEEAA